MTRRCYKVEFIDLDAARSCQGRSLKTGHGSKVRMTPGAKTNRLVIVKAIFCMSILHHPLAKIAERNLLDLVMLVNAAFFKCIASHETHIT
jgi:hypothetical protein